LVSPQNFSSYLRKPYELNSDAEQALREIIKQYPYFNNAWLLLSRSLHNQQSPLFDEALKQASMVAGHRALLYKLVNIDDADADERPAFAAATTAPAITEAPQIEPVEPAIAAEQIETAPVVVEEAEPEQIFEEHIFEPSIETEAQPIASTPEEGSADANTEQITSAYNEIFGAPTSTDNVATDFETFDTGIIHDEHDADFALAIDEDEAVEQSMPPLTSEENFELEVAAHLDADKDGIVTPLPAYETTEEIFELNVADKIIQEEESIKEEAALHLEEEDFELNIGEKLDADSDNVVQPEPKVETSEETFELKVADAIITEQIEEPQPVVEETDEEENRGIYEPIAFKLGTKEDAPKTEPIVAPATPVIKTEPEEEAADEESVLMAPSTFYEWLEQLKALQNGGEKKTEIVAEPVIEKTAETAITAGDKPQTAPATEAKTETQVKKGTSVDEIINRFISINPTISRPKAEFFNPVAKSKESDTPDDDLATETLAKIYRSQNLHERAIDVYERLIKLHPSKAEEYRNTINEIKHGLGN
jgi:tetratricopeptide (TPR) repeat protein